MGRKETVRPTGQEMYRMRYNYVQSCSREVPRLFLVLTHVGCLEVGVNLESRTAGLISVKVTGLCYSGAVQERCFLQRMRKGTGPLCV